ncbi:MAG: dockerin type I domain-containing protein, partial [Ruminococcus sp.]|nr:dockerin type I domain-containing protein [Ruminococcus sp.]
GNLLPCLAKDAGFPIFGERSGGGACSLFIAYTPELFFYTMSSYNKFITKDNSDVDNGAELDFDLTKQKVNADGTKTTDYSGLYDIEDIGRKLDAIYDGPVYGDVDGSGSVTITDATLIQKAAAGLVSFTKLQNSLADTNGDGNVSVADATCVQKYIAKYTSGCGKTGEACA